ncbi:hypothetical protein TSUD_43450 [Trifolium subterraneum]|uniref:Uncharacterized protein n=1 Tax=Trifolium subterraneum TaxID=3900 RepID=A0A2Z6N689_TRISU|nr:hypothetical protein TSUD_43450 [Trifolium subterraneum]
MSTIYCIRMARNAIIFKLEDFEWEKVVEEVQVFFRCFGESSLDQGQVLEAYYRGVLSEILQDVIKHIVYSRTAFFCCYLGRTSKGFVRIGLGWTLRWFLAPEHN